MTTFLVGLAIAVGVAGTLLPFVPGLGLIWVAAVIYGLAEGFGVGGWVAMAIISGLLVVGIGAGIRIPQRAAAFGGIPFRGQLWALALAVVGFFVIPVVGAAVGFVSGIYLVARQQDRQRAWGITRSTVRALVMAAGFQFLTALAMAATWGVWVVAT